jgi:hypothetical protein
VGSPPRKLTSSTAKGLIFGDLGIIAACGPETNDPRRQRLAGRARQSRGTTRSLAVGDTRR